LTESGHQLADVGDGKTLVFGYRRDGERLRSFIAGELQETAESIFFLSGYFHGEFLWLLRPEGLGVQAINYLPSY
jgi:hypothetical protein